mmetsp:Transcript_39749/g.85008  ORF Transcript_39749/g.85008 Transcript_39749/m.85008 type:complete len:94 (-) Transcript_39749:80-361(-)
MGHDVLTHSLLQFIQFRPRVCLTSYSRYVHQVQRNMYSERKLSKFGASLDFHNIFFVFSSFFSVFCFFNESLKLGFFVFLLFSAWPGVAEVGP